MNKWKLKAADAVSKVFGAISASDDPMARVLMYHALDFQIAEDISQPYRLDFLRFKDQMRFLARSKKAVVELDACVQSGCGIAITFDDGYSDTLTRAAPVLLDLGFPFTVFVSPIFIRSGDSRYLSPSTLVELSSVPGVAIGAHGYSHCRLTECSDNELESEVRDSRAWLEDLLAKPITTMSYPHGAVNARVRAAVANAGYKLAACSQFGRHRLGSDPLRISRTDIWAQDHIKRFESKISGHWDWVRLFKKSNL
jgi:peptidoglycan/xylan/chitin deacetylase (PgdA/CDA1 family)